MSGDFARGFDDFEDRVALSRPQVEAARVGARAEVFQGSNVCRRDIRHVDIVADTGTVAGRVVVSKDHDFFAASHGHLENERDQVAFRFVVLANVAGLVRTAGVEVTEANGFEAVGGFRPTEEFDEIGKGSESVKKVVSSPSFAQSQTPYPKPTTSKSFRP